MVHSVDPPQIGVGGSCLQIAATNHKPAVQGSDEVFAVAFSTHLECHVVLTGGRYGERPFIVAERALRGTVVVS